MKRQNRFNKNNAKKERIIMIASSAFVLAALTLTGVYVKNNSEKTKDDGYNIDFSLLEDSANDKYEEIQNYVDGDFSGVTEDDLDYTPMEQVDSGIVEIPGLTDNRPGGLNGPSDEKIAQMEDNMANIGQDVDEGDAGSENDEAAVNNSKDQEAMDADQNNSVSEEPVADFKTGDRLVWPVSGSVLIPYSMDKTVYFSTLEQYKYNPAIIISATAGDPISAAAAGKVTSVFFDEEIGNAVTVNIGNGYEITYGQLKDISVSEGNFVERGGMIGYVEAPTKYYSVEGTNVYFLLTLNGEPVNPMGELQ